MYSRLSKCDLVSLFRPLVLPTLPFWLATNPPTLWCSSQGNYGALCSCHIILFHCPTSYNINYYLLCASTILAQLPSTTTLPSGSPQLHLSSNLVRHDHTSWFTLDWAKRNIIVIWPNTLLIRLNSNKISFTQGVVVSSYWTVVAIHSWIFPNISIVPNIVHHSLAPITSGLSVSYGHLLGLRTIL